MSWTFFYLGVFVLSLMMGGILTWIARDAARRWGVLDRPSGRKDHPQPIPLAGGWAVFVGFMLIAGGGGLLAPALAGSLPASWDPLPHYLENLRGVRRELTAILVGTSWIFAVGLIDDLHPLGPKIKLIAQILAVMPLLYGGVAIHIFLPAPILGWGVTILWTVALMNAFNFMDNMDGLCGTVAAIIALTLALAAAMGGQLLLPALFISFAGIVSGFLLLNFHPASIFLGDAGSLTVGYLLAVFSIVTTYYGADQLTGLPVLIPLAVMGVPLFDAASVLFIRWRNGAPFMIGDHNHFSHRLRAMGFSVRQTALTIGLLTGAVGVLSLALRYLNWIEALLHLAAIAMLFGVIGALEFFGRRK